MSYQKGFNNRIIRFISFCLGFLFIFSSCSYASTEHVDTFQNDSIISAFHDNRDLLPGEDLIIHWSKDQLCFSHIDSKQPSPFSHEVEEVIGKAPDWLQDELSYQFQYIEDKESYVTLLKKASKQFTDEIAFCIAFAPLGKVPSPQVLFDNVFWLYEIDKDLSYADIIDVDNNDGNYFSTIRYQILKNGSSYQFELPKELYYWYIVHPRLLSESAITIYDFFWREYVYNHNDRGYPLLKEKIDGIQYLWDEQSYHQSANRLWTNCIQNHPTAIEVVSYWIGKTVPYQATGDRPAQPNIVAHQHNGWCGELQRLALAAHRTLLIPTIATCNIGEDHVWREFYHQGWHQNDNWWTDSGGTVDVFDVYAKNWGKDMSAVYTWKGDGSIAEVTRNYVPADDLVEVSVEVTNGLQAYDGALVTAFVKGPKDITWYKNRFSNELESIWNKLPAVLQQSLLAKWYTRLRDKINETPDIIDGGTATIWNYTDTEGICSFHLGKNDEYVFLIQKPSAKFNWPISFHNRIRVLQSPKDRLFRVFLPADLKQMPRAEVKHEISSGFNCRLLLNSTWVQFQKNIRAGSIGRYVMDGKVDVFVVNQSNLEKYRQGKRFSCSYKVNIGLIEDTFSLDTDQYIIIRNPTLNTLASIDISLEVFGETDEKMFLFTNPVQRYDHPPLFSVGNQIKISGVATDDATLVIDSQSFDISPGFWEIKWDTRNRSAGIYEITGICGCHRQQILIELVDITPPDLMIEKPEAYSIVKGSDLLVSGSCSDNGHVERISVFIDQDHGVSIPVSKNWSTFLSIDDLKSGIHVLTVNATDGEGNWMKKTVSFVINHTNNDGLPVIHEVFHQPVEINNQSNIVVYANVTATRFPLKNVRIRYVLDNETIIQDLFRYAVQPEQKRHHEDPLVNRSNQPIYGKELGQFSSNTMFSYQIIATDVALNTVTSQVHSITVN